MEEGLLQKLGGAGRSGSTLHDLQGAPLAENLLGGLASRSLPHGRTGGGQMRGQWGTKELDGASW